MPVKQAVTTSGNAFPDQVQSIHVEAAHHSVSMCLLHSMSSVSIPNRVGDLLVDAIADSAAKGTIISDKVFARLKNPSFQAPTGAAKYCWLFIAHPVRFKISNSNYSGPI